MDANRAETEIESKKLHDQLNAFQTEIEAIRSKVQRLNEENESLRRELRRSVEDRLSGLRPDALLSIHGDSVVEIQKKKIELLEQEKDHAVRLYDQTAQILAQLEAENNDLKNPLKPHLIKLDMQTKQAQEEHARAEVELIQEINMVREELSKRSRELVTSNLRVKELERQNESLQAEVYQKQDELRNHLKREIGHDGTVVAFQSSLDDLEVRLKHALNAKENAQQERDDMEAKLNNLTQQNRALQEKLAETIDQMQNQAHMHTAIVRNDEPEHDRVNHEQMHRTIDELIEQAAVKTRSAVEEVRLQYNENLERIMQEYNTMEAALNQKQIDYEKCLRAKRTVEEELDKILHERRLNLERSTLDNKDLAKRCTHAERERDEIQIKFEQNQQAYKILQQSFDAEKLNHEHKQKEYNDRLQKLTFDLEKMTRDYTNTFNELNELKKKFSSNQNEQTSLQRRMTELIKRHEEQMVEKEKDCLTRLTQRDDVNRTTFNELRNLVNRQQRMIVKYKEECHTIASQSETKISDLKQKMENLRARNEQLQSEVADVKRKEAEMDRVMTKNNNRMKTLEERLHDAEDQAIQASRRVAKQLVRDRLAITPGDHYSISSTRPHHTTSLFNLPSQTMTSNAMIDSSEHLSSRK